MTTPHHLAVVVLATLGVASLTGCGAKSPASSPVNTVSGYASAALADGTVTRAEVEAARGETVKCLSSEGFAASFVIQDDRVSTLEVDSGAPGPGESDTDFEQRFDSTIETCKSTYLNAIDTAWLRDTAPSEEEVRAAFTTMNQCLEEYSIVVTDTAPESFGPLLDRIDSASTPDVERNGLVECFSTYSLATATSEG